MTRLASDLAARDAEIASLKGALAKTRADNGHLRARLAIMSEREWAGGRRGIGALAQQGRPVVDETGFAPGAWV